MSAAAERVTVNWGRLRHPIISHTSQGAGVQEQLDWVVLAPGHTVLAGVRPAAMCRLPWGWESHF